MSAMRAWRVYIPSWQDRPLALTMAGSRGKAIARNYKSANEAGYRVKWQDFRVTRAPEFDRAYEIHGGISWDYGLAVRILQPTEAA